MKVRMLIRLLAVAMAFIAFSASSIAGQKCTGTSYGSTEYIRAASLVSALPEFQSWAASHAHAPSFGPSDEKVHIRGKCYWEVSVYANRNDRMEAWHLFYVYLPTRSILIQESSTGDEVPLKAWRAKNKRATTVTEKDVACQKMHLKVPAQLGQARVLAALRREMVEPDQDYCHKDLSLCDLRTLEFEGFSLRLLHEKTTGRVSLHQATFSSMEKLKLFCGKACAPEALYDKSAGKYAIDCQSKI